MSMELMVKAMKIRVGNPLRKLVLIKLADNASDQGECWPSYQHIADQCEISKRSVMNHITALCESGLVKKVSRKGEKGNSSNIYLLRLDGAKDSPGGSANNSLPSAANSPGGAGVAPGGSAGDSPRPVTLLNQSKNQSMNQLLAHPLTRLHQRVPPDRNIHRNLNRSGRNIPNVLVAIPSQQPSKPGKPVSGRE